MSNMADQTDSTDQIDRSPESSVLHNTQKTAAPGPRVDGTSSSTIQINYTVSEHRPRLVSAPSIRVMLRNCEWPAWPERCACCGGPSSTTVRLVYDRHEEHITRTSLREAPSCERCKQHQELATIDWNLMWVVMCAGIVIIGLVGAQINDQPSTQGMHALYGTAIAWVIWFFGFAAGCAAVARHLRRSAARYLGPHCSGSEFVSFSKSPVDEQVDRYVFSSEEYAHLFKQANLPFVEQC